MATRDAAVAFPGGDRFQLVGELGRGGMGVVYEVLDRDRLVRLALKGLRRVGPRAILRLKHEFRAVRDLQHPNLVSFHELFEEDGAWFFTMELVDGVDFLRWVRPDDPGRTPGLLGPTLTAATVADAAAARSARTGHGEPTESTDGSEPPTWDDVTSRSIGWRGVDEPRLRAGLRGLVAGVAALHRGGMVHRDIKPSNILVEPDGRVVLLDFGVVAEIAGDHDDPQTRGREVVGTAAYMAPEQVIATEIGPAADWYAVGVVLFEALTGELPYPSGHGLEAKVTVDAPSPRERTADLPADLVELCERLLRREPGRRPGAAELLERFGLHDAGPVPSFVGRASELDALRASFDAGLATGSARAVVITGESGIGKSALARRFLDELGAVRTDVLVLTGRCDERELVSYNALDGAVDALARYLAGLPSDEVEAPGGTRELLQIFPVLRGVTALAAATRREPAATGLDPRSLAFAALADLLADAAARRPVILLLDDVHWADADSLALLGELFAGADAPPVLLVATARAGPGGAVPMLATDAVLRVPVHVIRLGGLARAEAEALVRAAAPGADVSRLAIDTGGNPMFLAVLARRLVDGGAPVHRLDDALWQRIGELEDDARALLEVVALGAAALPLGTVRAATGLDRQAFARTLAGLRAARLVRVTGSRDHDRTEPYHDRVRETIASRLGADRQRALHRTIVASLEATGASLEVLAYHVAKAGDSARAGVLAEAAADRAIEALAFDRAAEWLRLALELAELAPDRRHALLAERADVLARAGRTAEAADAYLAAADDQPIDLARELRRQATEQLLIGGHLTRGRALARELAAEVGLTLPQSNAGAIACLVWYQTRLSLSRLRWVRRAPEEVAPRDRIRIDVSWSVATGLSMVDSTRGACFGLRLPLLAMPAGDPVRIARAICAAAVAASGMGRGRLAIRLCEAAHRAASETDAPDARAFAAFADVAYQFYVVNDWRAARAACDQAAALLPDRGSHTFEADVIEQHHVWSLHILGELRELRRRVPATIRSAHRIGNRFVEISHRTFFGLVHLIGDRPGEALDDLADAVASWQPVDSELTNPFFFALKSRSLVAMYQRSPDADPTLATDWARLLGSLLFRIPMIRTETAQHLGALAVTRAALARDAGDQGARGRHLAEARRWLAELRRISLPAARQLGATLAVSVAAAAGALPDAVDRLGPLLVHLDATGQRATAAAARWRLARLVGGSTGEAHRLAADRFFADEGVVRPDRLVDALLPGW